MLTQLAMIMGWNNIRGRLVACLLIFPLIHRKNMFRTKKKFQAVLLGSAQIYFVKLKIPLCLYPIYDIYWLKLFLFSINVYDVYCDVVVFWIHLAMTVYTFWALRYIRLEPCSMYAISRFRPHFLVWWWGKINCPKKKTAVLNANAFRVYVSRFRYHL